MKKVCGKQQNKMRLVAVLSLSVLFSLCLISGLYARYTTAGTSTDTAHVASFSITPGESYTTPSVLFEDIAPGDEPQAYTFEINSASDVAVKCSVSLSTTGNLPLTFAVNGIAVTTDGTPTEIVILTPHQGDASLVLTAVWPAESNSMSFLGEIDTVCLTITAEQVD